MTAWTPKLEAMIRAFGDIEERNTKDGCNPRLPMPVTVLRIAFRSTVKGQPLFNKICAEMGVTPDYLTGYSATLQKIIDLAAANNSDAADKLKLKLKFTRELNARFKDVGGLARIKAAKKGEIKWEG
ncbi:MAG: hypothetical protein EPN97_14695 [Alphaproteobacteria bacterium]|nr:MAG: hypothetical protein EPN97_14695 [Alphaproteobacteria bacterium]